MKIFHVRCMECPPPTSDGCGAFRSTACIVAKDWRYQLSIRFQILHFQAVCGSMLERKLNLSCTSPIEFLKVI